MAVNLLSHEVSDLCIGKPALRALPASANVGEALLALRRRDSTFLISVWNSDSLAPGNNSCAGKLCMVDILCYLCEKENIASPAAALQKPVSDLLSKDSAAHLRRIDPHSTILEALDVILEEGAQILLVPIRHAAADSGKKLYCRVGGAAAAADFCWLTQEDMVRFFFSSIAFFSPIAAASVSQLGLVRTDKVLAIRHHDSALSVLPLIRRALLDQTSVAVVTGDQKLIGEISPSTLAGCDISVAAALCALSAGDFMAYIDCSAPPPSFATKAVKSILTRKRMQGMLELMEQGIQQQLVSSSLSATSSPDEDGTKWRRRMRSAGSCSARIGRRLEEAVVCHEESSLVAVMAQALAYRVGYVWVVEEDYRLIGVVSFAEILRVFRSHL